MTPRGPEALPRQHRLALAALVVGALVLSGAWAVNAFTASVTVAQTGVLDGTHTLVPADLVPTSCYANGFSGANSLMNGATGSTTPMLGSATTVSIWFYNPSTVGGGPFTLNGGGSNDCMVPGRNNSGSKKLTVNPGSAGTGLCYEISSTAGGARAYTNCDNGNASPYASPYVTQSVSSPSGL
jgi:hypothetical protein